MDGCQSADTAQPSTGSRVRLRKHNANDSRQYGGPAHPPASQGTREQDTECTPSPCRLHDVCSPPALSLPSVTLCSTPPTPAPCHPPPGDTGARQSRRQKQTCRARWAQAAPRGDRTRAHSGASTPILHARPLDTLRPAPVPGHAGSGGRSWVSVSGPHAAHGRRLMLPASGPCLHRPSVKANSCQGAPPVRPHRCRKEVTGSMECPASRDELRGVGRLGPLLGSASCPTLHKRAQATKLQPLCPLLQAREGQASTTRGAQVQPCSIQGALRKHLLPSQGPTTTQDGSPHGPGYHNEHGPVEQTLRASDGKTPFSEVAVLQQIAQMGGCGQKR